MADYLTGAFPVVRTQDQDRFFPDGETIHTQYRITWELPHEGDMYTGDFAEEMKIARETAAKENEAEERRLKKEKEKKEIFLLLVMKWEQKKQMVD